MAGIPRSGIVQLQQKGQIQRIGTEQSGSPDIRKGIDAMAYVSSHRVSVGFLDLVGGFVASVKADLARRAIYAQTLKELQSLTDRELVDLGISPQSIHDIAAQAAYGR
jgi:uncharacterized protein YjiS (DUF1127 family)